MPTQGLLSLPLVLLLANGPVGRVGPTPPVLRPTPSSSSAAAAGSTRAPARCIRVAPSWSAAADCGPRAAESALETAGRRRGGRHRWAHGTTRPDRRTRPPHPGRRPRLERPGHAARRIHDGRGPRLRGWRGRAAARRDRAGAPARTARHAAGSWIGAKRGVCEFGGATVDGASEAAARARGDLESGADLLKVCVTGWPKDAVAFPDSVELKAEPLAAVMKAAEGESHSMVFAHAIGRPARCWPRGRACGRWLTRRWWTPPARRRSGARESG